MSRVELTIAGLGGQGSILAGVILGTAAVTRDGKYAVQTQAYSSELRGGFAAAWVVVDDEPVVFPRVVRPDVLVAQAQDSVNRFAKDLKPEGLCICDTDLVSQPPRGVARLYGLAATSLCRQELKAPVTANMAMLGALARLTGVVSVAALKAAIAEAVPAGKAELNVKAFDLGFERVAPLGN